MMETGKTYKHVASGRVIHVDYVGAQMAIATTLEPGNMIADVGDELVIRIPEAGWNVFVPSEVHTEERYVRLYRTNEFVFGTKPTERDIGKVRFTYTEGGSLTVTVL
jgi:hypothetical protein